MYVFMYSCYLYPLIPITSLLHYYSICLSIMYMQSEQSLISQDEDTCLVSEKKCRLTQYLPLRDRRTCTLRLTCIKLVLVSTFKMYSCIYVTTLCITVFMYFCHTVFMYLCIYTFTHPCIYLCIHVFKYPYIHIYTCIKYI